MKQFYFLILLVVFEGQAQVAFTTNENTIGYFGSAYAMNGNDIFAGSLTNNQSISPAPGSVYFFSKQTGTVVQQQIIESGTESLNDGFGGGLSAQGDYLAVAATAYTETDQSGIGKLYIFKKVNGLFEFFQILSAPDENSGDAFGTPYFHGDNLFVSAIADEAAGAVTETNSGSVYNFHFNGTNWDFAQKLEVGGTSFFGTEIRAEGDLLVISSASEEFSKTLHTFGRVGTNWIFQGTTNLFAEPNQNGVNGYHGFDLSEGQLYILRDNTTDTVGQNTQVVLMELNSGVWQESSSFAIESGDEYYAKIEVEADKLFVFDVHQYLLAMGRKWPVHYFRKLNSTWQFQTSFYSEAPSAEDDYFGRIAATDSGGMVLRGESYFFGPYTGKSYLIDFATLASNDPSISAFQIYPNPASAHLNIFNPNGLPTEMIKVISVSGILLIQQSGDIETIDVSNLSTGTYFLQIQFIDGSSATKRFIKS